MKLLGSYLEVIQGRVPVLCLSIRCLFNQETIQRDQLSHNQTERAREPRILSITEVERSAKTRRGL